jgi:DNA repair protein RecO
MKEYVKTTGIILNNSGTKENSASIMALTADHGMIRFDKHGYASAKNDSKAVLQPINATELQLQKHSGSFKLVECSLLNDYSGLKSDYNKTQTALSVFKTMSSLNIFEEKDFRIIFVLCKKFLETLNSNKPCLYTAVIYFFFQLAWCLGISFSFKDAKNPVYCYLQTENGLFFQKRTLAETGSAYRISNELYARMKLFADTKFADIHKLSYITAKEFNEFREMYKRYTEFHLNRQVFISNIELAED